MAAINFTDNTECVRLIDGPNGILAMLQEEGALPKGAAARRPPWCCREQRSLFSTRQCFRALTVLSRRAPRGSMRSVPALCLSRE